MSEFSLVPLGQLAEIRMGQSPDSTYVYEGSEQGVPFLQGNAEFGVKHPAARYSCIQPAKIAEQGSSLISVRAPVGETNIADQLYCIGRGLAAVKFHHYGESLGRELLSFSAKSLDKVSQGTTFAAIGGADLRTLLVADIPSQEAEVLESVVNTLDTQIQMTETLIAKLEKVKEGLLHDLLTRGIDENGQLRPSPEQAPELYKESPLGLIPKQWSSMTVGEALENKIILSIQDGNHGEVHPKSSEFTANGYPFVMANDIRENEIDLEGCHKIPESIKKRLRIGFSKEGDVLLSHKGTIGNCALVPREAGCVILTPQVTYYRCSESGLRPEYLLSFFKSHIFQSPLYRLSGQTTRSYLGITGQKALSLLIPPIEEQDIIKNTISQIDQKVKGERKHLVKLKTQKDGLMDDLLTGRVRVTPLLEQAQTQATTPA